MPLSSDIVTSVPKRLADPKSRSEADLRRATSDLYFALFHRVCETLVQPLAGSAPDDAFKEAYKSLYRMPEHSYLGKRCREVRQHDFAKEINSFANQIIVMKYKREQADYNPISRFAISDVQTDIQTVREVLEGYNRNGPAEQFRFACFVSMRSNRG